MIAKRLSKAACYTAKGQGTRAPHFPSTLLSRRPHAHGFRDPYLENLHYGDQVENRQVVVWAVALYLNGDCEHLPAFTPWNFGFPIDGALEILNKLATEGWIVAHVSEDRGLYKGLTNRFGVT